MLLTGSVESAPSDDLTEARVDLAGERTQPPGQTGVREQNPVGQAHDPEGLAGVEVAVAALSGAQSYSTMSQVASYNSSNHSSRLAA